MPSEDSKPIVKEETKQEEDENKSLKSILEARKKNPTNAGTIKPKPRPKVKKEEEDSDNDSDFEALLKPKSSSGSRSKVKKEEGNENGGDFKKPIKGKIKKEENDKKERKVVSSKKSDVKVDKDSAKKKKKGEENNGSSATQHNGKKREKKVYDLPGQKRDRPEERDPLRIFYESLLGQIPSSEMAQIWMMESGLLSKEEAKKVFEKKQKKNQLRLSSPMKAASTATMSKAASIGKKIPLSSVSSAKKKTADSKVVSKQSKNQKMEDRSSDEGSDEDFEVKKTASVGKKTPASSMSSAKKKTADSKVVSKQSKKRKMEDGSSDECSDEDFEVKKTLKKQRAS